MPVSLHILTGHGYHKDTVFGSKPKGVEPTGAASTLSSW